MKNKFAIILLLAAANLTFAQTTVTVSPSAPFPQATAAALDKISVGVSKITVTPSLMQKMKAAGTSQTIARVLESFDSNLTAALAATRKFDVVTRSDFDAVSTEIAFAESGNVNMADKNAARAGKIKGVEYILVTQVDDFQDYFSKANFPTLNKNAERRQLRFGAVIKLINSSTGSVMETVNLTISNQDINEKSLNVTESGNLNDALISEISRAMAGKVAIRVADVLFPAKIMAKTGSIVTFNRGDGTGVKVGDWYEIFALGVELIDPDTGEKLGKEEVCVGKAEVTRVNPKYSQARLNSDSGVDKGQVMRPIPSPVQKAEE